MAFDWTAAAFGILVAIIGALVAGLAALAKRELDQQRRSERIEDRLRAVEQEHVYLRSLADHFKRKLEEEAGRFGP